MHLFTFTAVLPNHALLCLYPQRFCISDACLLTCPCVCVVQVRYVGEREVPERMSTEHLRTEERVVEETVTSPCSPMECAGGCVPLNRGVSGNGVSLSCHHSLCLPAVWH